MKEGIFIIENKKKYKYTIDGDTVILHLRYKGENIDTFIDLEDMERVFNYPYKWFNRHSISYGLNYIRATVYDGVENGKLINHTELLHRFIMNADKEDYIDHINHNTLDNRKSNLRKIVNILNVRYRSGKNSNNKSGYRNVSKIGKWWCVQLQVEGKNTILKKFPLNQLDEAGAYAKEMREKYYGEFAGLG